MSSPSFVHLHAHTDYSMLDGAAQHDSLLAEAARLGMPALAATDHGNLFGAYDFWRAAKKHGVKPVIGVEAYLAPRVHRTHRAAVRWGSGGGDDVSGAGAYTHMTMLAATTEGMHNLFRQQSYASLEGQYRKPRVDRDLLSRYGSGIIATTGCASGEVQTLLRLGRYEQARESAAEFRDLFDPGCFYVEVMDHGLDVERRSMTDLLRLAKDLDLPLLATNDLHYVHAHDATAHDALLCVNSGSKISDEKRFRFDAAEFYLKTADEMRHLWREHPEACDNTLLVAEQCDVTFAEGQNLMPRFPVPDGESETSWLLREVAAGMARRFPGGVPADRQAQADYETDVIIRMGFPGYFLVTADFIGWAKANGIRVGPGRGSGAGSMAAYALGITDLDPMAHGLLFERFLNPERVSMPDFDVDFDERRRGEVIAYVTDKYGADRVAQIVTMTNIKAKAALKDAARVLGHPFGVGDRITKAMPPAVMGKDIPLSGIFDPSHKRYAEAAEFRDLHAADPTVQEIVEVARGLEGLKRGTGVHAAGVIMSAEPLIEHIPIMRREADGAVITQFEFPTCETLGMVKFDFLGLANLTIIDDAIANIRANRGVDVDLHTLPLDDPSTYDLLARGETTGVFQVEGSGMRSLLRMLKPDHFEDISAVGALYRPGPMGAGSHTNYALRKNGLQPVTPIHPELAEPLADILGDTYGLIVYQEQVMAIAQVLAGYSLGRADLLRRAMGKKKREVLDAEYVGFRDGMVANGYSEEAVKTLWDILVPFSDYAFNKAHTAAYGLITYWTAYLKANFPAEYMAALLTSNADDKTKTAIFLNECRRMQIRVLAPDVNDSIAEYAAVGSDIRVGLAAIRGVGHGVVAAVVRSREDKGRYADFVDYLAKVEAAACKKAPVEALIKAGAFDSLGHARRPLALVHAEAVEQYTATKKMEAIGQDDLFGALAEPGADFGAVTVRIPDVPEWDKRTLLGYEREMLGLYVSDHPLNDVAAALSAQTDATVAALLVAERLPGGPVTLGGLVSGVQRKITKAGATWAIVTLEDLEGSAEVLVFPQAYTAVEHLLVADALLLMQVRAERADDGGLKFICVDVRAPAIAEAATGKDLQVSLAEHRTSAEALSEVEAVLRAHPGSSTVVLRIFGPAQSTTLALHDGLRVDGSSVALKSDLKALLGPGCLATAPVPAGAA